MPEILECAVWQQENILSIAHEQEILVSSMNKKFLFRITNGQEVFTNIPIEQGEDMSCLMDRSQLYS